MDIHNLIEEYSLEKITMSELVKKLKLAWETYIEETNERCNITGEDYEDKVCSLAFKIKGIAELLEMRKLELNKKDGLLLVDLLREQTNDLEKLFKEVI